MVAVWDSIGLYHGFSHHGLQIHCKAEEVQPPCPQNTELIDGYLMKIKGTYGSREWGGRYFSFPLDFSLSRPPFLPTATCICQIGTSC